MLRIVADTNIYISALNFGGAPDRVLALGRSGRIEMFVSKPILDEIERVLKEKFQWPPERTCAAIAEINGFAREVKPAGRVAAARGIPVFFECWISTQGACLLKMLPLIGLTIPAKSVM